MKKIINLLLCAAMFCSVASLSLTASAADDSLKIKKTATANSDGTYTVTLEAFATGSAIITEKDVPTDIILVLDRSGSMDGKIGSVSFSAHSDKKNTSNYSRRHNGGSSNLWYKLPDDSYASVSVTRTANYSAMSTNTQNNTWTGGSNGNTYWGNRNNLYQKVGDEYKKVSLSRSGSVIDGYTYTYTFYDGTTVVSEKNTTKPNIPDSRLPLYNVLSENSSTVYTYYYTDGSGTLHTIGTSTGANTNFNTTFYSRSVNTSGGNSRISVLRSTVSSFADQVAAKAMGADGNPGSSDDVNHRIAVISFNDTATVLRNLTDMNTSTGATTIKNTVNNMNTGGNTQPARGIESANSILRNNSGTGRNKVIILVTDGYPAPGGTNDIEYSYCDQAIQAANTSKNDLKATVYTVGIFLGANPEDDIYETFVYGDDDKDAQRVAANRYMHFTSSNYKNAQSLNNGGSKTGNGYYLSAGDAIALSSIFERISEQVGGTTSTLGSNAVVTDIIAPSFMLPSGTTAANISIDTYACTGKNASNGELTFSTTSSGKGTASASINGDKVSVTGFDFCGNWCGSTTNGGQETFQGKKLVISFNVVPKSGFLGGNDVPTNTEAHIYENASSTTPVATYDVPTVNVPMKDFTVGAAEKNVYLLADLTAEQLKSGATVTVGKTASSPGIQLDLSKADDTAAPYGLAPWQTKYLNIGVEVKAIKNGTETVITDTSILEQLTDDTTYTVKVTMTPKTNGANSSGTAQQAKPGTSPAANINVFKPELTFKDLDVWYGDVAPENLGSLGFVGPAKWMHQKTGSDTSAVVTTYAGDEGVQMIGTAPTFNIGLTADEGKISDGKINSKQDIPVKATIMVGTGESAKNITGNTVFKHQACNPECGWPDSAAAGNPAFLLHPKTCQLTVTKAGGAADETYVFVVKKGNNPYTEVTIQGNRSVTVFELPVGNYKLEEVIGYGWSWRYGAPGWRWIYDRTQEGGTGSEITLNSQFNAGTITCTNSKTNNQWLNGYSAVAENVQTVSSGN